MTALALPVGLAWHTFGWLMGAWPLTGAIALAAMIVDRRVDSPLRYKGRERWKLFSPLAVTAATLLWASVFFSPAHVPPPELPWFAYVVGGLYILQLAFAAFLIREAPMPRGYTVAVVVLPQLWIGFVASVVALWAVTSGGTLGAL